MAKGKRKRSDQAIRPHDDSAMESRRTGTTRGKPDCDFKVESKLLRRGLSRSLLNALRGSLFRSLFRSFLTGSLSRTVVALHRGLHRASAHDTAIGSGHATAIMDIPAATTAMEQSTAATAAATVTIAAAATTMMATTTAVGWTTAIMTTIAGGAIATMATMTRDSGVVGAHQGDADGGEKHRHAKQYDSIHFCIPPFGLTCWSRPLEAAVLASRLQRWRVQGGGADTLQHR